MEAPKQAPPSLGRLNVRAKLSKGQGIQCANRGSQLISKSVPPEASKPHVEKSLFSKDAEEETASEDDEDDLDAMPKAPEFRSFSKAPVTRPKVQPGSIFPKTKPQPTSTSSSVIQSLIEKPTSNNGRSIFQSSTIVQPSKIEKAVPSKENYASTSSATTGSSRLAQIKKRLAERKRQEEEF